MGCVCRRRDENIEGIVVFSSILIVSSIVSATRVFVSIFMHVILA